jgi:hypothetical protein
MGEIRDYARCFIRNRASLVGAVGLAAGIVGGITCISNEDLRLIAPIMGCFNFFSAGALFETHFGLDTYRVYRKAKSQLRDFGSVSKPLKDDSFMFYCNRVGLELALEEYKNGK